MKKNEVPQDDDNIFEGKTKSIQYAIDENGNYVQVKSTGFEAENIALKQAWEEVNEKIEEAYNLVKKGEKSPVYYYMHKEIMDFGILAETVGLPKWRVKRHTKPKVFAKLNDKILEKYRKAFNLKTIDDLKNIPDEKQHKIRF